MKIQLHNHSLNVFLYSSLDSSNTDIETDQNPQRTKKKI